ncbi:MAG: FtsQ-type POTRA domain-containing protein [Nitrosomonas sp.]|nr:MAG: FtsQ-type POTRA domain-containing protein [Nitrosomonas sp.]
MWNNHQALNMLSKLLFTLVTIGIAYAISLRLVKPPFFPIKELNIRVAGNAKSDTENLLNITRHQIAQIARNEIKGNFVSVDLVVLREAFLKLPWVRDARVTREWPDGLNVAIEEHQPLAYWGSRALVNTHGEVFRVTLERDLPIFIGPKEASAKEVAQQYRKFSQILNPLRQSIAEINLTPRYAWRIKLHSGTILELGRDEIEERLIRYVSVYHHSIARFEQEGSLAYVDLRYPNGFAIRTDNEIQQIQRKSDSKIET